MGSLFTFLIESFEAFYFSFLPDFPSYHHQYNIE